MVAYRCEDCLDRWDIVLEEEDNDPLRLSVQLRSVVPSREGRGRVGAGAAARGARGPTAPGRPATGCARPMFNALAQPRRRSRTPTVRRPLRRQRRARHRGAVAGRGRTPRSSTPTARAVAAIEANLAATGLGRPGHRGRAPTPIAVPRRRAGGRRFDLALLDPPYAFDGWADLLGRRSPADARRWSSRDRERRPRRRVGVWSGSSGTASTLVAVIVRRHPPVARPAPHLRSDRDARALPGIVRPDPQRPPRDHRDRVAPLRRGRRGGHAQPAEGRAAVQPRRAPGDDRGVARPPRQRQGHDVLAARRRPGPGGRRRLHRQGPARRLRLRVRAADGPDEPQGSPASTRSSSRRRRPTRSSRRSSSARSPASAATSRRWSRRRSPSASRRSTPRERLRRRPRRAGRPVAAAGRRPQYHARRDRGDPAAAARHHRRGPTGAAVGVVDDQQGGGARAARRGASTRLPEELRAARWLLKEREEYLAKVRHEGDEILDAGPGPGRAHGAAHRGREGGRAPGPPDRRRRPRPRPAACATRSRTSATRSWPASRSCSSAP